MMGMPLELNTMIVTKGREQRLENNFFTLKKEGYRLYPVDITGTGVIKKVELSENAKTLTYQLISLNSTN